MGRHTKNVDIHYEIRASERGAVTVKKLILEQGIPVEKRLRFSNNKKTKALLYEDLVHIFSFDLKKRITVVPYSKRKWKLK